MKTIEDERTGSKASISADLFAGLEDLDDDIWCLERADNPDIALCGNRLGGVIIPLAETPEENICPACRNVRDAANAGREALPPEDSKPENG